MGTVVGMKTTIKPSIERLINQAVAIETESAQDAGALGLIKNQLRFETMGIEFVWGMGNLFQIRPFRGVD